MADPQGFLKHRERSLPAYRPVPIRLMDWKEVYEPQPVAGVVIDRNGQPFDCAVRAPSGG